MKYFNLYEFELSSTAKRKGINNSIPDNLKPGINLLVDTILDPLAEAWGTGIIISSGYRGTELNKAVGGSNTSAHSYAYAADLVPTNGKIGEFKQFVMDWLRNNNIAFDLYINEIKSSTEWVHIGVKNSSGQQRKQYMLYKNGKYTSINPLTFKADVNSIQNNTALQTTNTQTNSSSSSTTSSSFTPDLLTGKSVYYADIDYASISSNEIYTKDEDGKPIAQTVVTNGKEISKFLIDDNYLSDPNYDESIADNLENINDLQKEPDTTLTNVLDSLSSENVEIAKGIIITLDGTVKANKTKSTTQIIKDFQKWTELVDTIKKSSRNATKKGKTTTCEAKQDENNVTSINAQVYIESAFDKFGRALREGLHCPVCGKTVKYLPPGGYCSVECAMKDAIQKSISFLKAPDLQYKKEFEKLNLIIAVLNLTTIILNAISALPDLVADLVALPDEYKDYINVKIAEGFSDLQVCLQELMITKNKLIISLLKPIKLGAVKIPILALAGPILAIQQAMQIANDAFNTIYSAVMLALKPLVAFGGLGINAESFAWAATPHSFISIKPYTCPDMGKIFVNLPGGAGLQTLLLAKPGFPSALETMNFTLIDSIVTACFPPLLPTDYYLEPALFEIRYLFSDQSDLVMQIRLQIEDLLSFGPDYIPKFENLLPVKQYRIGGKEVWLPNLGYVWFLLGLLDAWAPHSTALVGSLLNPLL